MHFDGNNPAPIAPHNEIGALPEPGTPAFDRYVEAENAAREIAGSGFNAARAATLARDRELAEETRRKHGAA